MLDIGCLSLKNSTTAAPDTGSEFSDSISKCQLNSEHSIYATRTQKTSKKLSLYKTFILMIVLLHHSHNRAETDGMFPQLELSFLTRLQTGKLANP